jgi:hypothetical protein
VKKAAFSAYSRPIPKQQPLPVPGGGGGGLEDVVVELSAAVVASTEGGVNSDGGNGSGDGGVGVPSPSPCLTKGCAMGYTMLFYSSGHHYRYTEWVHFPGPR